MTLTQGESGILGLAPTSKNQLKEASFLYELKKYRKIDHLVFSINMGKGFGESYIKFGSWDAGALKDESKGLTSI
jgi:hypothetical protein